MDLRYIDPQASVLNYCFKDVLSNKSNHQSRRVPGLFRITWWIVLTKKLRGHSGYTKCEKYLWGERSGLWEHTDSWINAQKLEPNTNAQRMSFLSHLVGHLSRKTPHSNTRYLSKANPWDLTAAGGLANLICRKKMIFTTCVLKQTLWLPAAEEVK